MRMRRILQLLCITFIFYLLLWIYIHLNKFTAQRRFCQSCITINQQTGTLMRHNKVYRFIAGQMEYFRIPFDYWEDRLIKAKAAGLDAIEFYIPWNYHERSPGEFDFTAHRNITHYLDLIMKHNLLAVARIGPYVCAEWTLGGIPPWLWHRSPSVQLRSLDPDFLNPVTFWFARLLPMLKPHLQENGGPIFMVQIENEYGQHPNCDQFYMRSLYKLVKSFLGQHVIYFTVDLPIVLNMMCNSLLPLNVIQTIDFGPCDSRKQCEMRNFHVLEEFRVNQPLINSEFYTGWFDQWGRSHPKYSSEQIVESFWRQINYSDRVSLSFYMFHGGTTFGLWNGANTDPYSAQTTSYDYAAPISEAGDLTTKYSLIRKAIFQAKGKIPPPMPTNLSKAVYPMVTLTPISHLLLLLSDGIQSVSPRLMETMQQYEGIMVYVTKIPTSRSIVRRLQLDAMLDTVHVVTGEKFRGFTYQGCAAPERGERKIEFTYIGKNGTLFLLVENGGYVNFGPQMYTDQKGLRAPIFLDNDVLLNWTMYPLCLNSDGLYCPSAFILDILKKRPLGWPSTLLNQMPLMGRIYAGAMHIDSESSLADTFIQPVTFNRGLIYVNSILLGRFDQTNGPQLNLYLPKPFLRVGKNEIVIVELNGISNAAKVIFNDKPLWKKQF